VSSLAISNDGVKFIASFEGYHKALPDGRCKAYRAIVGKDKNGRPIHDGKWTIGFGCTEGIVEGLIWTREEAELAFRNELARFEVAVNRLVKVPISQNAYDALVSFAYNCGESALASSALLRKLNAADYGAAAREFPKWVNSNGVKNVPGLVRRRAEEAAMFLRPDPVSSNANEINGMPQTVDAPAPVSEAVKSSRTVRGTLLAGFGIIAAFFKEWLAEATNQISLLAPMKEILGGFGLDGPKILLIVTIAGCMYAFYARIDDAKTGANVK
jgi:lysozyme